MKVNQMIKMGLIVAYTFGCVLTMYAQKDSVTLAVYGELGGMSFPCLGCDSGGSDGFLSIQATLERNRNSNATATRFILGAMNNSGDWYPKIVITGVYLSGKGKSHFELDYGLMWSKGVDPPLLPIVNIGYRFQDLQEPGTIFRIGLGLEYVGPYIGYGITF